MQTQPVGLSHTPSSREIVMAEPHEVEQVIAFRENKDLQEIFPFFFQKIPAGPLSPLEAQEIMNSIKESVVFLHDQIPADMFGDSLFDTRAISRNAELLTDFLKTINEYSLDEALNADDCTLTFSEEIEEEEERFSTEWFEKYGDMVSGIQISGCYLLNFPKEFCGLPNLRVLGLENVGLSQIPPNIQKLQNLQRIYLANNPLTRLPQELFTESLELLDISNNVFNELPPELFRAHKLLTLRVAGNELTKVSPDIRNLQELTLLDLAKNQIHFIPTEIKTLESLEKLYVQENELRDIPPIGNLKNLKKLRLNKNFLGSLPQGTAALMQLEELSLSDNQIGDLPFGVGYLACLRILDIRNNRFETFPQQLLKLSSLESISIEGNPLTGLPRLFIEASLPKLQKVTVSNNPSPVAHQQSAPPISCETLLSLLYRYLMPPLRPTTGYTHAVNSLPNSNYSSLLRFANSFRRRKTPPAAIMREFAYSNRLPPLQRYRLNIPRKTLVSIGKNKKVLHLRRNPLPLLGTFGVRQLHPALEERSVFPNLRSLSLDLFMLNLFPRTLRDRLFQDNQDAVT